tara:strand:- start:306 stop:1013 length:708 start_codon:yes stop_codon:yes gene_type:complete
MAYLGREPNAGAFEKQSLTADGSTTTFTLSHSVGSSSSLLVSVSGVIQEPESAYNIQGGGTQIVFSAAPESGETVFIIFLGGQPFDAGVFVSTGTITTQTELSTGVQGADTLLIHDNSASSLKKITLDNFIKGQTELAATAADDDVFLVLDTDADEIKKIQKSNISSNVSVNANLTGDGSTTAFTLGTSGRTAINILVTVNGIVFHPSDDYTLSGTTLTFTQPPSADAEIRVRYL